MTADHLTLSYRVIYPLSLSGPIPTTGITLHAGGLCPPDNVIKVRVCVQDCSGNGDLRTFDNGVSANCNTYSIILKDITVPTFDWDDSSSVIAGRSKSMYRHYAQSIWNFIQIRWMQ